MHTELAILRAMLRLQRRRATVDLDTLLVRVGGTEAELRVGLRTLQAAGFVERGDHAHGRPEPRLTMAGLAVAVAQIAPLANVARRERAPARRTTSKHRAA